MYQSVAQSLTPRETSHGLQHPAANLARRPSSPPAVIEGRTMSKRLAAARHDDDANDFGDAGDEFSLTRKRTPRARAPPPSDRRRNTVSTKQPRGRAYFSQVAFA